MDEFLERYARFWAELTPEALARLELLFSEQARFKDPFNDVRGLPAIRGIFEHMYQQCLTPEFQVLATACRGDTGFLHWLFRFRSPGRKPRLWQIEGCSRVRFEADGRVSEHVDFWDPAEQLYERLPAIGGLFRVLRRRLSAGA